MAFFKLLFLIRLFLIKIVKHLTALIHTSCHFSDDAALKNKKVFSLANDRTESKNLMVHLALKYSVCRSLACVKEHVFPS